MRAFHETRNTLTELTRRNVIAVPRYPKLFRFRFSLICQICVLVFVHASSYSSRRHHLTGLILWRDLAHRRQVFHYTQCCSTYSSLGSVPPYLSPHASTFAQITGMEHFAAAHLIMSSSLAYHLRLLMSSTYCFR